MTDTTAPNVIAALARVMADLPAIGKDQTASAQQGGYAYRGIEQITQAAQPLLARHGVVFVPRIVAYEIREITVNGKPWTDTIEQVEYDVFGPGGTTDKITVGPILAIGRDNSDKGANKCLTQAFKYALLQALCISDAKDDADGHSHEAEYRHTEPEGPVLISAENVDRMRKACADEGVAVADVMAAATDNRTEDPAQLLTSEIPAARDALRRMASPPGEGGTNGDTKPAEPELALDNGASVGTDDPAGEPPAPAGSSTRRRAAS